MFESPLFDVHMIFGYLHKATRSNIVEYLMNKVYREYRNDVKKIDFYLFQLCYMTITKPKELSMPIERFIL